MGNTLKKKSQSTLVLLLNQVLKNSDRSKTLSNYAAPYMLRGTDCPKQASPSKPHVCYLRLVFPYQEVLGQLPQVQSHQ